MLSHRDSLGETDINLAIVAFALSLDEVVQPAETLRTFFTAASVGGVLGGFMELVEADRNPLQQNIVTAAVQICVGHITQQSKLGRQHLPGARTRAFD